MADTQGEREMLEDYNSELRQDNAMLRQALRELLAGPTEPKRIAFARDALGESNDG